MKDLRRLLRPKPTPAQKAIRAALANAGGRESKGERDLRFQLQFAEIPFRREAADVIPGRKFRFDFALDGPRVLVEVEGAIWKRGGGGHSHPSGIERDIEKASLAAANGWRLVRGTTDDVREGRLLGWIRAAIAWRPAAQEGRIPPAGGPLTVELAPRLPTGLES